MQNTITLSAPAIIKLKFKVSLKSFLIINLVLIGCLLFFYFFQINEMIRNNYLIKDLEPSLNKLNQENLSLENSVSKSNSLDNIEKLAENLNFEKVGDITYIDSTGSQVVAK